MGDIYAYIVGYWTKDKVEMILTVSRPMSPSRVISGIHHFLTKQETDQGNEI